MCLISSKMYNYITEKMWKKINLPYLKIEKHGCASEEFKYWVVITAKTKASGLLAYTYSQQRGFIY